MLTRIFLTCVGIGLLSGITLAQNETQDSAAPPAADSSAAETPAAPTPAPLTRADLEAFAMRIESNLAQWQQQNESRLDDNDTRLARLEEKVQALSDVQESGRQALEQIAKKDADGTSYLRIDASHEPTREELRRAIVETTPKTGTVIIRNTMDTDQAVSINGQTYDVFANDTREVQVNYGDFRVKVRNKPVQVRSFSFPRTDAVVKIVPEYTAARPVEPVSTVPTYTSPTYTYTVPTYTVPTYYYWNYVW